MHKKIQFFLLVFSRLFVVVFWSCQENSQNQKTWPQEQFKRVLDSLGSANVIASFNTEDCFYVLVFDKEENNIVKNLTFRLGYPIFIDTLIYKKRDEFKSRVLNTTYYINDSSVVTIQYVKIIHPSSNWQGQTPWQQPYVNTYLRTDKISKTKQYD